MATAEELKIISIEAEDDGFYIVLKRAGRVVTAYSSEETTMKLTPPQSKAIFTMAVNAMREAILRNDY